MNLVTEPQAPQTAPPYNEAVPIEHRMLRSLAGILERGVAAGQLAHDLAGPLTTLCLNLEFLDEELSLRDGFTASPHALQAIVDMRAAVASLQVMTGDTMTQLREGIAPGYTAIDDLLDGGARTATILLAGHARAVPRVLRRCEAARVWATSLHAKVIGNIMVNGALQQEPGLPLEIDGGVVGDRYRLRVRDFGIAAARREARIEELRRSVSLLGEPVAPRATSYRGHGMALVLARTLMISTGGDLRFEAPPCGDGLVVSLDMPLEERDRGIAR